MKKYVLALDQGTTGSRAIVYDRDLNKVASAYEEFPQYFPKPGWVEHDPEEIWKSVNNCIQKVLKKVPASSVACIGITNQRETAVVWDSISGRPVHNAIVWQCRRTADRCAQLKKIKGFESYVKKTTGLPVDAYFSGTKVEWMLSKVKSQKAKGKSESQRFRSLRFGTTDSWVLWKLTGGKVHATDFTNASRTMLFDIKKKKWDKKLLKTLGIPYEILPEVKSSSGLFGKTSRIGSLPEGIPITGIAGDQQAALFGQGCSSPGESKNTYGTGCFMLLNTGKKYLLSKNGLITTIACGKKGEPVYALEGSVFIAGAAVQWLRDGLKMIKSSAETEGLALSVKDNEGVYFVPAFVGLGAPYWDPEARGIISGVTRGTTRGHIARAALEAMCYSTREVLEAMERDSKLQVGRLQVDGGAVANNFLCQFQADILGVPVIRPKIIETTSLGAALLAGLSAGIWKSTSEIIKKLKKDRVFFPKMRHLEKEKYFLGWKKAVKRALSSTK